MNRVELEQRTKGFAMRVVQYVGSLPKTRVTDVLGYQLLKAGTPIGANYREANRAESRDDFIHKVAIAEKEAGETQYWLEILDESDIGDRDERRWLLRECGELLAILAASGKTAKANRIAQGKVQSARGTRQSEVRNPQSTIRNPQSL